MSAFAAKANFKLDARLHGNERMLGVLFYKHVIITFFIVP